MEDIATTEGQKKVQISDGSCNNSTDSNDKAANETQPVFIEPSETVAVEGAVVKEAQRATSVTAGAVQEEEDRKEYDSLPHHDELATGTTATSTLPSPEEVSHKSREGEITSLSTPLQGEVEVEKTPAESRSGSFLLMPNINVDADESIAVISSGVSMEVDSQTQQEAPSATTNPNKPLLAELQDLGGNGSSSIEIKNEEMMQKAIQEQNPKTGKVCVVKNGSDALCADVTTTMMDMVTQESDVTTSIKYKGKVGIGMRSR